MLVSCTCLVVTCFAYTFVKQFQNVPGRNVLTLATCLLISYIFLVLDLILRDKIPSCVCIAISIVIHVTFLATFFWTNVLAFDIMWCTREAAHRVASHRNVTRYWRYSAYAWTATLLVALPAVVLDRTGLVPRNYSPNFGKTRCWLSSTRSFLLYFSGPVGIILLINGIIFIRTAATIARIKNMTAILNVGQHRKRFRLYVKLVMVMGLVWLTEFVPWITGVYQLYAIAGMLNSLHGVFLFVIFVCRRKVLAELRLKCCFCCSEKNISFSTIRRRTSPSVTTIITSVSNGSISISPNT